MSDSIRVNGKLHSWGSIYATVNGEPYYGFTSIGYGDNLEVGKGYGMGRRRRPRGRSVGKYQTDPVTLKGHTDSVQALRQAIADAAGGSSFGGFEFEIVVQYEEPGLGIITDTIEGCTWTKNARSGEEGSDPLQDEIELDCLGILWNGLALYEAE